MPTFRIENHLIIPFGCPKWAIEKIRVSGVSTGATYFQSESPIAYINRGETKPLRLWDVPDLLADKLPTVNGRDEAFNTLRDHLRGFAEIGTDFERRFLDLYFEEVQSQVDLMKNDHHKYGAPWNNPLWVFGALAPLPQAHLYMQDPLSDTYSFEPQRMVRVDFAFWTGKQLVAVEIDGASHVGSPDHVKRDRMLQRAGVHVIHILNEELLEHGAKAINRLMPAPVRAFWKLEGTPPEPRNPLTDDIPF